MLSSPALRTRYGSGLAYRRHPNIRISTDSWLPDTAWPPVLVEQDSWGLALAKPLITWQPRPAVDKSDGFSYEVLTNVAMGVLSGLEVSKPGAPPPLPRTGVPHNYRIASASVPWGPGPLRFLCASRRTCSPTGISTDCTAASPTHFAEIGEKLALVAASLLTPPRRGSKSSLAVTASLLRVRKLSDKLIRSAKEALAIGGNRRVADLTTAYHRVPGKSANRYSQDLYSHLP